MSDDHGVPDDERLLARACGHSLRLLHSAIDCDLGPDHDGSQHSAAVQASAYRTALGIHDGEAGEVRVAWVDRRPAATAGDLRRHLQQAYGMAGGPA